MLTSKIIQILPNKKNGGEHASTSFFHYNFIALCEDGSLWGYNADNEEGGETWELIN